MQRFYVDRKYVFALTNKALDLKYYTEHSDEKYKEREIIRFNSTKEIIDRLTMQYFEELGSNAYAVLNVIPYAVVALSLMVMLVVVLMRIGLIFNEMEEPRQVRMPTGNRDYWKK